MDQLPEDAAPEGARAARLAAVERADALRNDIVARWEREGIAGPTWEEMKAEIEAEEEERVMRWFTPGSECFG